MDGTPRVLLVAVGGYGMNYLKEMTERDTGAEIAGICEVMPDIEEKFPVIRERAIPVYSSMDAFYARDHADLAVISSPIHFHTEMALNAFAHGSHVLCEKPLCLTLEEARRMEAASRAADRFLAIGYQFNYQRDVLALKRDILSGRFGAPRRLRVMHAMRRGAKYYGRNNWAGRIAANGREVLDSPFSNACAHYFQLMTFLLGPTLEAACGVTGVEAELYRANPALENFDTAALRYHTEAGAPILYYTSHALYSKKLGPSGVFEFERATVRLEPDRPSFRAECEDGTVIDYSAVPSGERLQKLYDAIGCVKGGGHPICGLAAEYPHIQAVRMAQQNPILPVSGNRLYTVREEDDTFLCVRGLEDVFAQSAQSWSLPREAGFCLG